MNYPFFFLFYQKKRGVHNLFIHAFVVLLYILSRSEKTGEVKIVKYISSQEELDLLPEDESSKDYKINSNGTCSMSAGFQYTVAERKGEEGE